MPVVVIQPYILVSKQNKTKTKSFSTLYWLPKLHTKPYKARCIANSSSCTTTELSKWLTGKNLFQPIKNSGEILYKLKARDFKQPNCLL